MARTVFKTAEAGATRPVGSIPTLSRQLCVLRLLLGIFWRPTIGNTQTLHIALPPRQRSIQESVQPFTLVPLCLISKMHVDGGSDADARMA